MNGCTICTSRGIFPENLYSIDSVVSKAREQSISHRTHSIIDFCIIMIKENMFGIGYQGLDKPTNAADPVSNVYNIKSGIYQKKFSISGKIYNRFFHFY